MVGYGQTFTSFSAIAHGFNRGEFLSFLKGFPFAVLRKQH
jgi:hypothetical protein